MKDEGYETIRSSEMKTSASNDNVLMIYDRSCLAQRYRCDQQGPILAGLHKYDAFSILGFPNLEAGIFSAYGATVFDKNAYTFTGMIFLF